MRQQPITRTAHSNYTELCRYCENACCVRVSSSWQLALLYAYIRWATNISVINTVRVHNVTMKTTH